MVDSLFLSPAFIFAESSFIIVASIAAYELLVGDFIWAQQEEARRASMQSRRGRGYDSIESRQMQLHGHRSLSPGGRGRGQMSASSSRRGSSEESSLLYPPRSRGGNRDARISEEGYYSSTGDTRFASPGRGSSGDSTRRLFYKAILLALLSRFILLPLEICFFPHVDNNHGDQNISQKITTIQSVLLRISQTLPDVAFASALGLLVIFCAQIAFAAMPPLTPDSREGSIRGDDDAEAIDDGTAERDGALGEGAINGPENIEGNATTSILKRNSRRARTWCTRLSRTMLASKKTFATWNAIIFTSYTFIFVAALAIPHTPLSMCEISLWILMVAIYSFLLLSLVYVGVLLGNALRPGIAKQKNSNSLAIRLAVTCTLLAIIFLDRVVSFGMVAHHAIADSDGSGHDERIRASYRRSTIDYAISESLPVLFILFMMHRKRKEIHNDVLILWSLFGSTGGLGTSNNSQLDTTAMSSASGDGTGSAAVRGGGLSSSRRFQTYGGTTRGDSFPPSSGNKARRNMPRASSSSGGGARSQQQHPIATDASALESGSIVGSSKKGGLKPYVPVDRRPLAKGSDER